MYIIHEHMLCGICVCVSRYNVYAHYASCTGCDDGKKRVKINYVRVTSIIFFFRVSVNARLVCARIASARGICDTRGSAELGSAFESVKFRAGPGGRDTGSDFTKIYNDWSSIVNLKLPFGKKNHRVHTQPRKRSRKRTAIEAVVA